MLTTHPLSLPAYVSGKERHFRIPFDEIFGDDANPELCFRGLFPPINTHTQLEEEITLTSGLNYLHLIQEKEAHTLVFVSGSSLEA